MIKIKIPADRIHIKIFSEKQAIHEIKGTKIEATKSMLNFIKGKF